MKRNLRDILPSKSEILKYQSELDRELVYYRSILGFDERLALIDALKVERELTEMMLLRLEK